MLGIGAYTGINLDGGSSTGLIEDDGLGKAKIINRPTDDADPTMLLGWEFAHGRLGIPLRVRALSRALKKCPSGAVLWRDSNHRRLTRPRRCRKNDSPGSGE